MSDSFGAGALRLAGVAARLLGWRPDEFWRSTPAELAACLRPPQADTDATVGRAELEQMMDTDHDRRS